MKNTYLLIVLALSALVVTVETIAEPVVYGKANVSLNMNDSESNGVTTLDNWQLNSNASRLGVKGDLELDNQLKAIYQLEYEVAVDNGIADEIEADCDGSDTVENCGGSSFKQRNIFVGIEGGFGSLIAGKHDTPLKLSQEKIDLFNDLTLGDIKDVFAGENRADNIIMYSSPSKNGFEGKLAFMPGEDSGATAGDDNGPADSISGSVKFSQEKFWLGLAVDSEVKGMDLTRLSAEYSFAKAKLAAMLQNGENTSSKLKSSGFLISGQYKIDLWTLKAQYLSDASEAVTPAPDVDTTMITFGADYKLSPKAKLFAYASRWEQELDVGDDEQSTFGLGAEVNF
jgi:predicted porin